MDYQKLHQLFRLGDEFSHRKYRSTGMNDTECRLCSYISSHDGCSQEEAGQKLGIDKTTVTKALQSLENDGMLLRQTGRVDRRKKLLTLTEKGKQTIADIADLHEQWFKRIFSCLNEEEQCRFADYCHRLLDEADKLRQG